MSQGWHPTIATLSQLHDLQCPVDQHEWRKLHGLLNQITRSIVDGGAHMQTVRGCDLVRGI